MGNSSSPPEVYPTQQGAQMNKKPIELCKLYRGSRATVLDVCGDQCPNPCPKGRISVRKASDIICKKHSKLLDYMTTGGRIR